MPRKGVGGQRYLDFADPPARLHQRGSRPVRESLQFQCLTPNTVELVPIIGALFPEAGPSRTRSSYSVPSLGQTAWVRIPKLVPVASIVWGQTSPNGHVAINHPINLPPRCSTQVWVRTQSLYNRTTISRLSLMFSNHGKERGREKQRKSKSERKSGKERTDVKQMSSTTPCTRAHKTSRAPPIITVQGYLAHKKQPLPETLQQDYADGPLVVLGGSALAYERGTHVWAGLTRMGRCCMVGVHAGRFQVKAT